MNTQGRAQLSTNPLLQLRECGQAIWLDFLSRKFIADGELQKLVEHDGLTGVTSNPSIFEKAVAGSADYDASLKAAEAEGDRDVMALYERLAIEDIQHAADVLRPVYERTNGQDGYVSLEVSPYLAMNTEATIVEARRLWSAVGRANIMIKVPATKPGLPARVMVERQAGEIGARLSGGLKQLLGRREHDRDRRAPVDRGLALEHPVLLANQLQG